MLFSKEFNFIFIANPKTGSRAVRKALTKWNVEFLYNKRPCDLNGEIGTKHVPVHISSNDLKLEMKSLYESYKIFVFVRSPYGRAVSTYFFYRKGNENSVNNVKKSYWGPIIDRALIKLNYFLTVIFPFSLYSLIKPFKTNSEYIIDSSGRFIVNYIGKTESFNIDLVEIGKALGIDTGVPEAVEKVNQSSHKEDVMDYFKMKWHYKLFTMKYKKEIELYNKIAQYPAGFDWRNRTF